MELERSNALGPEMRVGATEENEGGTGAAAGVGERELVASGRGGQGRRRGKVTFASSREQRKGVRPGRVRAKRTGPGQGSACRA